MLESTQSYVGLIKLLGMKFVTLDCQKQLLPVVPAPHQGVHPVLMLFARNVHFARIHDSDGDASGKALNCGSYLIELTH